MTVFRCSYWSMEIADWEDDGDGGCFAFEPPDKSAVLHISTPASWAPAWKDLVAEAGRKAPPDTEIHQVSCGDFAGLYYEYIDDGEFVRSWRLTLAELYLLVAYSCDVALKDRDRSLIDGFLSTLKDCRA